MLRNSQHIKKKLVQNFQFDPNEVKVVEGYDIIDAKNILLNEVFTLKRLSLLDSQNHKRHQSMLRQISMLKELSGTNIIKCHKILKSKSHLYLVYDYFSGRNLAHVIQRNQELIDKNQKIDPFLVMKLQEDFVDYSLIQTIGKQLCQVLKEIQNHKIVHMRFWPENVILSKSNSIKMANFSNHQILKDVSQAITNQEVQKNLYVDPFLEKTKKFGFYTDIYSFAKILEKIYEIYRAYDSFKPNKNFQELIAKMVQPNAYKRPKLQEIHDFFSEKKRKSDERVNSSGDDKIQKFTNLFSTLKRTSSVFNTTSHKQVSVQSLKIGKSNNEVKSRPKRSTVQKIQKDEMMRGSRQSNHLEISKNSQSNKKIPTRRYSMQIQNLPNTSREVLIQKIEIFKIIISSILKKRNLSALLLKIGNVVVSNIIGENQYAWQLVFLLYKKSFIEIDTLAKFLSHGSKNYMPDVTETNRLKFSKTEQYSLLSKIINKQLNEQRNVLRSVSSLVKSQSPQASSFRSKIPSLKNHPNELKYREKYISELLDFEKEIRQEPMSNEFFLKTIHNYLDIFVSDLLLINKKTQNAKENLFFLNILYEIHRCGSYENLVKKFFSTQSKTNQTRSSKTQNLPTYMTLLNTNLRFSHLGKMNVEQLARELIFSLQAAKFNSFEEFRA